MYTVLGEGNANTVYVHPRGLLRVSKSGKDPAPIIEYYKNWARKLEGYIGQMDLVEDPHHGKCILMEHVGKDRLLVEFKPKWLVQSPDAPQCARVCRTCAVDALRGKSRPCPLALASGQVRSTLDGLDCAEVDAVEDFLKTRDLLPKLAQAQAGPSLAGGPSVEFLDAMSARDCTLLIEQTLPQMKDASEHCGLWLRARLVDLDPKDPSQMQKWRTIEASLDYFTPQNACMLSNNELPA